MKLTREKKTETKQGWKRAGVQRAIKGKSNKTLRHKKANKKEKTDKEAIKENKFHFPNWHNIYSIISLETF
jgi:hypothetical protein